MRFVSSALHTLREKIAAKKENSASSPHSKKSAAAREAGLVRPETKSYRLSFDSFECCGSEGSRKDDVSLAYSNEPVTTWEEYDLRYTEGVWNLDHPPRPPAYHPLSAAPNSPGGPANSFDSDSSGPYIPLSPPNNQERHRALYRLDIINNEFDVSLAGSPPPAPIREQLRHRQPSALSKRASSPTKTLSENFHADDCQTISSNPFYFRTPPAKEPLSRAVSSTSSSRTLARDARPSLVQAVENGLESLVNHPLCMKIAATTRKTFHSDIAILAVADDDDLVYLSSTLGGDCCKCLVPFTAGLCAHTALTKPGRGFCVLDTLKNWRFKKGPAATELGVRFYCGMPLTAPLRLEDPVSTKLTYTLSPRVIIGSLCIVDQTPRDKFSTEDRRQLAKLAEQASHEIEVWATQRLEKKILQLEANLNEWAKDEENEWAKSRDSQSLFTQGQTDISQFDVMNNTADDSAIPIEVQVVLDLAVREIAATLQIPLVYIVAVHGPKDVAARTPTLKLLTSTQDSRNPLWLNPEIHLQALESEKGGLRYENPLTLPGLPQQPASEPPSHVGPYAVGLLLTIQRKSERTGTVLAGFAKSRKRIFGNEDLVYLKKFAKNLEKYCDGL